MWYNIWTVLSVYAKNGLICWLIWAVAAVAATVIIGLRHREAYEIVGNDYFDDSEPVDWLKTAISVILWPVGIMFSSLALLTFLYGVIDYDRQSDFHKET